MEKTESVITIPTISKTIKNNKKATFGGVYTEKGDYTKLP